MTRTALKMDSEPTPAERAPNTPETPEERLARHLREKEEHDAKKAVARQQLESEWKAAQEAEEEASRLDLGQDSRIRQCVVCGVTFTARILMLMGKEIIAQRACEKCVAEAEAQEKAEKEAERTQELEIEWETICPPDYQDTDKERLLAELTNVRIVSFDGGKKLVLSPQDAFSIITGWPATGKGLGLIGKTGLCKTRLMMILLKRYHSAGIRVGYVNCARLEDEIGAHFSIGAQSGHAYVTKLEKLNTLFLDDIGKGKLNDRAEEALYRILEQRRAFKKRTFFSANCVGKELEARMSADRGEPIVRRLRDLAETITFTPNPQQT